MRGFYSYLEEAVTSGKSQVTMSTHAPLLAALPSVRILELGDWGYRHQQCDDLDLVANGQRFLSAPQRYLRHL